MAIIRLGLTNAGKSSGQEPSGTKSFLVGSDVNIGDDIDQILDASVDATTYIPAYDEPWSADDTSILVRDKNAAAHDVNDGVMDGFWWKVDVDYEMPQATERALDPRDRDWEWSKDDDKREITIAAVTFKADGYTWPGLPEAQNLNLDEGAAWCNTNGVPVESGVQRTASRKRIRLTKYVSKPNGYTDLGATSWDDLDSYVDTVNDNEITILGVDYTAWDLLVDSIQYESVTENGYEVIKVDVELIADKEFQHVFSYFSSGYEEYSETAGGLIPIEDKGGGTVSTPQLLDASGAKIPYPASPPYIKSPTVLNGGRHILKTLDLNLPASIP